MSKSKNLKKIIHITLMILNIFVSASLIFACLSCFINPKTIWWFGLFGLAYLYILAINICFVVIWALAKRKKLILISAVSITFGLTFLGRNVQLFGKEIHDEDRENSFQVISFNVHGFSKLNRIQSDGKELNLFDFLRDKNADIICLQEYKFRWWDKTFNENAIKKKLENTPYYHKELRDDDFGLATFSKYPIIHKELVYHDRSINICMCSDIVMGADTVRVYNVHLKSVGFQSEEKDLLENVVNRELGKTVNTVSSIFLHLKKSSLKRADQVMILMSHINQSPYPVIICGDFNDTPVSHSYQKVRGNRKDAFVKAGSGRSATFNIKRVIPLRIDYIMYSDVFKAYSYESPRVYLSDHFPVMCRLVKNKQIHP